MKRALVLFLLAVAILGTVSAQQFAKTGVVNLTRVYKELKGMTVQEWTVAIQKDIDPMKDEIKALMDQLSEADKKGDSSKASQLTSQIQAKKEALTDFSRKKQEEFATFQKLLTQEIEQAAISSGCGVIVNSANSLVLWWGPDAEITNDVIHRLQADLSR